MTYQHKMTALPQAYDTAAIEKKWQKHWLAAKTYAWNPNESRDDSYVIDTPPPTVSGTLHMGHVFSYTQADIIARFQRMTGKNVFYPMGFDDNGLPTERLVEKTKKIRAADMSREQFIAECLSVSEEARKEFRALFESIALSVDWEQEYHTISDSSRRLSQLSFLDLVEKKEVYRKLQPMLWDPVDQTAIAQAEIVDKELPSHFTDIAFTCEKTGDELVIGTTRPELLPACVALFFHPDDERYKKHAGHRARVPLFGFSVPIMADESVEPEKGTGLMMCCTFGDEKDIEKWQKHDLPTRMILNKYAKMDFSAVPDITGELAETLKNKKVSNPDPKNPGAREIMLEALKTAGLIRKQEAITHAVKTAERSGAVLELLPTQQWFVKVLDKKDALKTKAAECNWNPAYMKVRIDQWIDGLNWDWCISRQKYFGVPFPVWYSKRTGEEGKAIFATADQLPVNPLSDLPLGYTRDEIEPDTDVMDTWATSSISPQLSAHAISSSTASDANRFSKLYPADLRPQAHEIIRTWAFYTIVKSYLHNQLIPWKDLMISGWCLAEDKTKMSKSKGNVVTPVALIEEKGTDAVRYWTATSRLGQDTAFSPDLLKIGRKLVNKLWNATQFAAIHLEKMNAAPATPATDSAVTEVLDRWILSRLGETVAAATKAFHIYEYAEALDVTNQFFWADFCDNYLELIKKRVYNEDGSFSAAQQQSAVRALYYCLDTILKLYAPFCPHVTEELYSHIFAQDYAAKGSLHARGMWPKTENYAANEQWSQIGKDAVAMLEGARTEKSNASKSIKYPVSAWKIDYHTPYRLSEAEWQSLRADLAAAANADLAAMEMHIHPLAAEGAERGTISVCQVTLAAEADAA